MQNKITKPEKTISLPNLPGIIIAVVLIVGIGTIYGLIGYLFSGIKENVTPVIQKPSLEIKNNYFGNEFIQVKSPQKNAAIETPILISGKANVYEANVRIRISDDNKNVLADDFITAGGWMDKLYSFEKEVAYKTPQTENGLIEIFEESVKDGSEIYKVEVPVVFEEYEDAFSDWEIYRNEEFGYEIKHPLNWEFYKINNSLVNITSYLYDPQFENRDENRVEIEIKTESYDQKMTLNSLVSNKLLPINDNFIDGISFLSLNGYDDIEFGMYSTKSYYLLSQDGKTRIDIKIRKGNDESLNLISDQILSTFKFIEKDETANWQTYRNEEFGYEMKYSKNVVEIFPDSVFERGSKGNPSFKIKSGGHFALGVWENSERLSFKEWLEKRDAMGTTYSVQEVMIGNHKGYSALNLIYSCHIEWRGIEKENKFYTFGVEICEDDRNVSLETFDQILSTFKFIEK